LTTVESVRRVDVRASADRRRLAEPAPVVAPLLLGARLTSKSTEGRVVVELTEVEAYAGAGDPASHTYRGRTQRNAVMFGPAGFLYVYFSYGMHWCANVVTGSDGEGSAVLLRAGRVVEGTELARVRRRRRLADRFLARGPATLTQALGIGRDDNGTDVLDPSSRIRLELQPALADDRIASGPRVGISVAADVAWRFWIAGDPSVSTYQRSPRAPAARQKR
jgi:DNA-3-methyladenine glycosylase